MPTVTTSELVDRAKAAADMRDNFVTPTQWMYWASQERLALDYFLARSGWPQTITTENITATTAEFYDVSSATGVMAIVCVHQVENGKYRLLRHQNVVDFNPDRERRGHAKEYRVVPAGTLTSLQFYPNPIVGEVYQVTYLAHPQRLDLTAHDDYAAAVNYPMGWEERIVLGMARRALVKEESDTRAIDQEIALWDSRIEEACWSRVLADAPVVRNSDAVNYGWTDRYSIPPYTLWTYL